MTLTATCHCGATRITLPDKQTEVARCNCTYCQRAGALWSYHAVEDIQAEASDDRIYSPTGKNEHHFCGACGMQTHGYSPDWGSIYNQDGTLKDGVEPGTVPTVLKAAVNLNMIDDLDQSSLTIKQMDGRNSW